MSPKTTKRTKSLKRLAKLETGPDDESTVVWGREIEKDDYLKLPRVVIRLARYLQPNTPDIASRHLILLIALATRKFKNKPIRAYWEELAVDLGVKKDTVRKWAYELRDRGLLRIRQHRGRDPDNNRVGYRNERNSFDIRPFVQLVDKAFKVRQADRKSKRANGGAR